MKNFKQLIVWQKAIDLFMAANILCKQLPKEERYETCSQLRRAALSIPSNIAEGSAYTSQAQYKRFLEMALGSSFEVETILIAIEKSYPESFTDDIVRCNFLVTEIQKMLITFIKKLTANS